MRTRRTDSNATATMREELRTAREQLNVLRQRTTAAVAAGSSSPLRTVSTVSTVRSTVRSTVAIDHGDDTAAAAAAAAYGGSNP